MDGMRRGSVNQPPMQGYGAYNPNMPGADLNQYFHMIASMVQGQRERKEKGEQEEYERGMEERKMQVAEGKLEFERGKQPPEPDFMKRAKALMTADPEKYKDLGTALNAVMKIQPEEQIPPVLPKAFEAKMTKEYGTTDWRPLIGYDHFKDVWDEDQARTRPSKPSTKDIPERERGRQIGFVKGVKTGVDKLKRGYEKAGGMSQMVRGLMGSEYSAEDTQGKKAILDKISARAAKLDNKLIFERRTLNPEEEAEARILNTVVGNFEAFWGAFQKISVERFDEFFDDFRTMRADPRSEGKSDAELLEALLRVF